MSASTDRISDLESQLTKKQTFAAAVATLTELCRSETAVLKECAASNDSTATLLSSMRSAAALVSAADNCMRVLKTRHTASTAEGGALWLAGLAFFRSLEMLLDQIRVSYGQPVAKLAVIREYVGEVLAELGDEGEEVAQERGQSGGAGSGAANVGAGDARIVRGAGSRVAEERGAGANAPPSDLISHEEHLVQGLLQAGYVLEAPPDPRQVHHLDRHELRLVSVDDPDGVTCSICLEDIPFGKKAKKMPGCGHLFHDDCIMECLEHNKACPMCRDDPLRGVRVYGTEDEKKDADGTKIRQTGIYS